jgi:hypothetical protein
MLRLCVRTLIAIIVLFLVPVGGSALVHGSDGKSWYEASRRPTGLAPDPAATREAVIQIYAARAFGWRGAFGVHTWIAVKPENAGSYTRFEVMGWGVGRGRPAVRVSRGGPDNEWYGNAPELIGDLRGPAAQALIPRIRAVADSYPYPDSYQVWPGPNSNTFVAHVGREIPELRLEMPALAIGKDFIPGGGFMAAAPSGTGYQLSVFGAAGVLLAVEEGLEVNLFGLTLGLDPGDFAIKLPGIGRIGL